MKRILSATLFMSLAFQTCSLNAMAAIQDPLFYEEYDGIVKIVLSNRSGKQILVNTNGAKTTSLTLKNNSKSPELSLLYYSPIKSLFDNLVTSDITFSSKQGVYQLIMWQKKNDTMHLDILRNQRTESVIENLPNGSTLLLEIDRAGKVNLVGNKG